MHTKLDGDVRDRPSGDEHQIDRIPLEPVKELPARPWLFLFLVVSHRNIVSSMVSDCKGEVQ